jgi:1,4-alpha-glucan branching enzyme
MLKKSGQNVTFRFDEPSEWPVFLVGDFNNWDLTSTRMRKIKDSNWSLKLELKPGEYQYRYYCEGQWYNDHGADRYTANHIDGDNSVVVVTKPATGKRPQATTKKVKAKPQARKKTASRVKRTSGRR